MADGPNVFTNRAGVIIVRASAFGHCERQLWAAYDGVQPMEHKDVTKRAFKEGHLHEDALVEQRTQEGYLIESDQAEVVLKILPNKLHIVGHIDGVISEVNTSEYDPRLWEAKSMSRAAFDDWVAGRWDYRPGYKWQLAIYMLGMKLDKAWYDVKRRDDGFIDTWMIDEPPYSKAEIRSRALMLYKMFKTGDMPDCTGEGGAKWFCEYWFLHDEEPIKIDSADEPIDNVPELDALMGDYYEAVNTETWARKERARIKAEITDKYLSGRSVVRTEHHVLKINDGTSTRFDKAAMSAELGQNVVDRFTKKTPTKVWKIDTREG